MRKNLILTLTATVALTAAVGCSQPETVDGDITDPPPYFGFDINATQSRRALPDHTLIDERGYSTLGGDEHSSIHITEYESVATEAEVEKARAGAAARYSHAEYSELMNEFIDGRTAWAWTETQARRKTGEILALKYTAIIPYDDRTFAVEFYTSQEKYMDVAVLQETVRTFEVGEASVNYALIFGGLLVAGFGFYGYARLH